MLLTLTRVGLAPFFSRMRMRLASLMALVSVGKISFFSGEAVDVTSGRASAACNNCHVVCGRLQEGKVSQKFKTKFPLNS